MTATLQPIERSVLESLAEGRDDIQTAAQLRVPVNTVAAIQQRFGPTRDRIRQVLDAATPPKPAPPKPIGGNRAQLQLVGIEALLDEAKRHTQQRIVKKGARIQQLVDELAAAIAEERETEQRRRREAAEREAALAEIASLEQQLAAARAKAGVKKPGRPAGTKSPGTGTAGHRAVLDAQDAWLKERGVTFPSVLTWAKTNGLQKGGSLLSNATKTAWDEAHPDVS